jgi:hypothetical protein
MAGLIILELFVVSYFGVMALAISSDDDISSFTSILQLFRHFFCEESRIYDLRFERVWCLQKLLFQNIFAFVNIRIEFCRILHVASYETGIWIGFEYFSFRIQKSLLRVVSSKVIVLDWCSIEDVFFLSESIFTCFVSSAVICINLDFEVTEVK